MSRLPFWQHPSTGSHDIRVLPMQPYTPTGQIKMLLFNCHSFLPTIFSLMDKRVRAVLCGTTTRDLSATLPIIHCAVFPPECAPTFLYKLIAMNRCQILTLVTHVKPHAADIECKFFATAHSAYWPHGLLDLAEHFRLLIGGIWNSIEKPCALQCI